MARSKQIMVKHISGKAPRKQLVPPVAAKKQMSLGPNGKRKHRFRSGRFSFSLFVPSLS